MRMQHTWGLCGLLVLVGAAAPALAQPTVRNLAVALPTARGVVRTAAGVPVANARVTLFNANLSAFAEVRTNASGAYFFKSPAAGARRLGVAAPGFDYQEVAFVPDDLPVVQNFTLAAESHPGAWAVIGNTAGEFFDAGDIGILLADGRIMYCHDTITPVIFDPVTGQSFVAAGSGLGQGCMNITLLADGRPIFVGGLRLRPPETNPANCGNMEMKHSLIETSRGMVPVEATGSGRARPGRRWFFGPGAPDAA